MRRILLGLTGSVASVLYLKLIEELQQHGIVDVILTERSKHFVNICVMQDKLRASGGIVYTENEEWIWREGTGYTDKWAKNDPVLHIQLRDKSSALVIAPCSANTLAKLANGICDNLLTSVARAWDRNRPFILAPAMNTNMWDHPITKVHLKTFVEFSRNNHWILPQSKMLACNTYGMGAMCDIHYLGDAVKEKLKWTFPISRTMSNTDRCDGIPVGTHPGAFEAHRKNSIHTGVDLYADVGTAVSAMEDGRVVAIEPFTGPKDKSPWWLDTDCVLVEGASGVICYGELEPFNVTVGDTVWKGSSVIGRTKKVIPPDKPQHPEIPGWKPSMLHIELYPHGYYKPSDGYGKSEEYLQDPTPYLIEAMNAPGKVLTYDKTNK